MAAKHRNYWTFSIACFVVWAVLLTVSLVRGNKHTDVLLVFAGWVIAWVAGTIARYVYPPPPRWRQEDVTAS
jgi:hypothetical protein